MPAASHAARRIHPVAAPLAPPATIPAPRPAEGPPPAPARPRAAGRD